MSHLLEESPLVSCITPTCDRHEFLPLALRYFRRQTYARRELIVVDDGSEPVEAAIAQLDESDGDTESAPVRIIRLPTRHSVGKKRNIACEAARGDIILHWDDDDWQAPGRIAYQVAALGDRDADMCGLQVLLFYDLVRASAWRYRYPPERRFWLSGSTLAYRREVWRRSPFPDVDVGEDARFVWGGGARRPVVLEDPTFHVGMIHGRNISPKRTSGPYWQRYDAREVRRLLGTDWELYHPLRAKKGEVKCMTVDYVEEPSQRSVAGKGRGEDSCIARQEHLALPEFAAFNHGHDVPRMRRWEMPWTLFQARLTDTMAVLDCTINPVGMEQRLHELYPHVLYRHWNPVREDTFVLPRGLPDGAFDRVFCVNTLEHLLAEQRRQLVQTLAGKLKPGGRLILTSDYYFDSLWENEWLRRAGVMRADRTEIFNGWNKVTPREWLSICGAAGLSPVAVPAAEPVEEDDSLYRNHESAPHASLGGVFTKPVEGGRKGGGQADEFQPKRVALNLLTWNTCDVSLESAQALLDEAHLLERLGHEAFLCICDNGSTDGTVRALKSLERSVDIPHRFVYNAENRGNSVARNQMIDAAWAAGADYLLFLDGDIEIVPFSSFALLRQMETYGRLLGCLGADSTGQTPHRARMTPYLYTVSGLPVDETDLVAWTQYGMFRREVFADGVRFDEEGPFAGPGWGFEDNDLAFQIRMAGYLNMRFYGMTYLHRAAHSSLRLLGQMGVDAREMYERRKRYLVEKWSGVEPINTGPLPLVRQVRMPGGR